VLVYYEKISKNFNKLVMLPFLTHSRWNHREVIDHVARDADNLLGHEKNACLLIDESGFAKQGKESVGVSRQWLGRL